MLSIFSWEALILKHISISVLIASLLFTITKIWKHKYTTLDECTKKMWYLCAMDYYSAIKKNKMLPFAVIWMDLEGIMLSEVSQTKINII